MLLTLVKLKQAYLQNQEVLQIIANQILGTDKSWRDDLSGQIPALSRLKNGQKSKVQDPRSKTILRNVRALRRKDEVDVGANLVFAL